MLKVWLSRWLGMGEVLDYAVQVNKRTTALEHELIELQKRVDKEWAESQNDLAEKLKALHGELDALRSPTKPVVEIRAKSWREFQEIANR